MNDAWFEFYFVVQFYSQFCCQSFENNFQEKVLTSLDSATLKSRIKSAKGEKRPKPKTAYHNAGTESLIDTLSYFVTLFLS